MRSIAIFFIFSCASLNAGWLERKAEGWAWYEDKAKEREEEVSAPPKKSSAEIMAETKKELEELLAEAILNPTQENIVAYITLQKKWMDQSGRFSEEWTKVLLDHPQLDPTAHDFPVSHYGRQVARKIKNQSKEDRIKELSEHYGLIFFYEGKDKVSQAFSLIVKDFGKKYNWDIIGISCDGTVLDGFRSRADNGIAKEFGLAACPTLFAVTPNGKEAVPIAYGLASFDKIENNLILRFPGTKERDDG